MHETAMVYGELAPPAGSVMQARGMRDRARLVGHKLAPPATFMREWSPLARRGPLGLAAAYVWRPFWILSRTPHALRAWARARTKTKRARY